MNKGKYRNNYRGKSKKSKEYSDKKYISKKHNKNIASKKVVEEVVCIGTDELGKGLIKYNDRLIAIPYLLTDEKAKVEITIKGNNVEGRVLKIINPSPKRVKPECNIYYNCGGCHLQHMSYEEQENFKMKSIEKLLNKFGKVNPIIYMKDPKDYRNKIHATYSYGKNRQIISGFYQEKSHKVIPVNRCIIQDAKADEINASIRELMKSFKLKPYDEDKRQGFLRHVLIKRSKITQEVMVVLVTGSSYFPSKNNFVKALVKKHPEITTVILNINDKKTSMVLGEKENILYGKGTIRDILCGCYFNISAKSFYQVNPVQTEKLYNKAIEMANFKGNEVVLDAYCGIGTIGIILSKKVKSVIGVELNKDAVKDAIKNARLNKINNIRFIQGDAGEYMLRMVANKQKLDTVIMDPPRSGSDQKFLSSLINIKPKTIVYISCNYITQARDLEYLTNQGYKVSEIQPVDLFPKTSHVETIVKLDRL